MSSPHGLRFAIALYPLSEMTGFVSSLLVADFDGHMDWDGGWGVLMVIGMVLFWVVIIGGIVWLVRELSGARRTQPQDSVDDPVRILDRRLADGSISLEDYRERRAVLTDREGQ